VLEQFQLQFTDEVINNLQMLDKALHEADNSDFDTLCDTFYRKFGSHAITGLLHYGGIFIWKCFTLGHERFKEKEVRALQDEVISSQMDVYGINQLPTPLCVSGLNDHIPNLKRFSSELKDLSHS
jgi:hypothetical protein